jgi:SpoVK/Ycf46/Vps4 family AAA+-type ATPase
MASNRRHEAKSLASIKQLTPLGFSDRYAELIESLEARRTLDELVLSKQNREILDGVLQEFRRSDTLRRHGLDVRSKLLFCGPPGCGKTITAEALAWELGLPLFVARLDGVISSYLGETAANLSKAFDAANSHFS